MSPWHYISDFGVKANEEPEELRKIHLINQMSFISVSCSCIFIPYVWLILGNTFYAKVMCIFGALMLLYMVFSKMRRYYFSVTWVILLTAADIFWGALESPTAGIEFFLVPLSLVPFTFAESGLVCVAWMLTSAGAVLAAHFIQKVYVPFCQVDPFWAEVTYVVSFISMILLGALIIFQFKVINRRFEHIISEQKQEVEQKNKEITDSIRYASRIQRSILPNEKVMEKNIERMKNEY